MQQVPDKKNTLTTILAIACMAFCIVFAPSLKTAVDLLDISKKRVTQQLLEEEPHEKQTKLGQEVYDTDFSQNLIEWNYQSSELNSFFYSSLKTTQPYLKVHTPPPDISLF